MDLGPTKTFLKSVCFPILYGLSITKIERYVLTDLPSGVGNVTAVHPCKRSLLLTIRQPYPIEPFRTDTRFLRWEKKQDEILLLHVTS